MPHATAGDSAMTDPAIDPAARRPTGAQEHEAFPSELQLVPWVASVDPTTDHLSTGPEVERYWLPVLGPTSTVILRNLGARLAASPEGCRVGMADLARRVGLGTRATRNSPAARAIDRLCYFGIANRQGGVLALRTLVPPVPAYLSQRLPRDLREELVALAGASAGAHPAGRPPIGRP
jgi:hypothetical protein